MQSALRFLFAILTRYSALACTWSAGPSLYRHSGWMIVMATSTPRTSLQSCVSSWSTNFMIWSFIVEATWLTGIIYRQRALIASATTKKCSWNNQSASSSPTLFSVHFLCWQWLAVISSLTARIQKDTNSTYSALTEMNGSIWALLVISLAHSTNSLSWCKSISLSMSWLESRAIWASLIRTLYMRWVAGFKSHYLQKVLHLRKVK